MKKFAILFDRMNYGRLDRGSTPCRDDGSVIGGSKGRNLFEKPLRIGNWRLGSYFSLQLQKPQRICRCIGHHTFGQDERDSPIRSIGNTATQIHSMRGNACRRDKIPRRFTYTLHKRSPNRCRTTPAGNLASAPSLNQPTAALAVVKTNPHTRDQIGCKTREPGICIVICRTGFPAAAP